MYETAKILIELHQYKKGHSEFRNAPFETVV